MINMCFFRYFLLSFCLFLVFLVSLFFLLCTSLWLCFQTESSRHMTKASDTVKIYSEPPKAIPIYGVYMSLPSWMIGVIIHINCHTLVPTTIQTVKLV